MIALLVIVSILFIALGLVLFLPFFLEIDIKSNIYCFRMKGIGHARFLPSPEDLFLDIRIGPWHRKIDLLKSSDTTPKKEEVKIQKERRPVNWKKIKSVIRSFSVKRCVVKIDTGDFSLNGKLFPLLFWLRNRIRKNIGINFRNENEFSLLIQNTIARMLWAYLKA